MKSNSISKLPLIHNTTWNEAWPVDELESVPACPICKSTTREILRAGLIDNVFFVASGKLTLYSCSHCRSAYLDPWPNQSSIGKAYGNYYTHASGTAKANVNNLGFFRRLR